MAFVVCVSVLCSKIIILKRQQCVNNNFVFLPHSFVYAFVCFVSLSLSLLLLFRFISCYRSIRLYNSIKFIHTRTDDFYSTESSRKPIEWRTFCVCLRFLLLFALFSSVPLFAAFFLSVATCDILL